SFERANQPSGAVDEHWGADYTEEREAQRATSDVVRAADLDRSSCLSTGIASEDHLRVEHRDEAVIVTRTRSRGKGGDDTSLSFHADIRNGPPLLNTTARAAGQLASRIGGALDDGRDLLEGHSEDVVQHERDALGRRKGLQH